ncbi:hypothetical protein PAMP_007401 [Pampus punctatissimus]
MEAGGSLTSLPDCINPNNFPAKLWRLVNNPANRAICWDSCGEVIIIDQQLFEKQILSPGSITSDNADAFKTTNFSSFVRQLNLYGFRKADTPNIALTNVITGTIHRFINPNFKRNHSELLVNLRRLTVDNKAKLQAGLNVNCRPPSRYQRHSVGDDERDRNMKRGSSILDHKESSHPSKAQLITPHNGTPVPPRYLIRGHDAAHSSSVFAADKGIPISLSHHYSGVASSPNALHIQQGLLTRANHSDHNFTSFNAHYQPGYYSPGHPVNNLCHGDQNQDFQIKAMKKCDINLDTVFQIADNVMQTPNNSLIRVVTPEKPDTVSLNPGNTVLQVSLQNDNAGSTRKDDPLNSTPIITAVSGNINLVTIKQEEGSVVSVPEQMPEDAICESPLPWQGYQ